MKFSRAASYKRLTFINRHKSNLDEMIRFISIICNFRVILEINCCTTLPAAKCVRLIRINYSE